MPGPVSGACVTTYLSFDRPPSLHSLRHPFVVGLSLCSLASLRAPAGGLREPDADQRGSHRWWMQSNRISAVSRPFSVRGSSHPPRSSTGADAALPVPEFLISFAQENGGSVYAIHFHSYIDRYNSPFSTRLDEQWRSADTAGSRTIMP
jgi:hypothetical protein